MAIITMSISLPFKRYLNILALLTLLLSFSFVKPVYAAASAVYTVETSVTSANAGSEFDLLLYVTVSDGQIYASKVNVKLTNAALVSFNAENTSFGFASLINGNQPGSTAFEVGSGYFGRGGGQGKLYIGKVKVQVNGATGNVTVDFYNPEATEQASSSDPDEPSNTPPIPPSSLAVQGSTITITSTGSPTCPSGKLGTPPDCFDPPAPGNNTTSPNSNSNVAVPPPSNDPKAKPNIITEQELANSYSQTSAVIVNEASPVEQAAAALKKSAGKWALFLGTAVLLIGGLIMIRTISARSRWRTAGNNVSPFITGPAITQNNPLVKPADKKPTVTPDAQKPAIIRPAEHNNEDNK